MGYVSHGAVLCRSLHRGARPPRTFIIPVRIDDVPFGELPMIHQLTAIDFTSGWGVRSSGSRRIGYAPMSTSPPPHPPTTLLIDKRATLVQDASVFSAVGER